MTNNNKQVLAIFTASILMMGIVGITQLNSNPTASALPKKELQCNKCTIRIEDSEVGITVTANDGANGQPGGQGAQGEKGDKGDKGDPGERGANGTQGIQGVQGEQGIQGIPGHQGEKGDKGDQGTPGQNATIAVTNGTLTETPVVLPVTNETGNVTTPTEPNPPVSNETGGNVTVPTEPVPPVEGNVTQPEGNVTTPSEPPVEGNVTVPIEGNITIPGNVTGTPSTGEENDQNSTTNTFTNDETPDMLTGLWHLFGK